MHRKSQWEEYRSQTRLGGIICVRTVGCAQDDDSWKMEVVSVRQAFLILSPISDQNNSFYSQNQFPPSETLGRKGTSDFWGLFCGQAVVSNAFPPSEIREIFAPKACIHFLYSFWNGYNLRGPDAFFDSVFTRRGNIDFVGGWNKSRNSLQCSRTLGGRKLVYACIVVAVIFAAQRRLLEWGIQEEVCCDWLSALKKSV